MAKQEDIMNISSVPDPDDVTMVLDEFMPVDDIQPDNATIDKAVELGSVDNSVPVFTQLAENKKNNAVSFNEPSVVDSNNNTLKFNIESELGFNWASAVPSFGNRQSEIGEMIAPSFGFYVKQKYREMDAFIKRGHFGFAAMIGSMSDEDAMAYGDMNYLNGLYGIVPNIKARGLLSRMAGESASLAKYMIDNTIAGATAAGIGAGAAVAAGQIGPLMGLPEEIVTVPFMAKHGYAVGAILNVTRVEGGALYLDLIENGVDPKLAKPLSLSAGVTIGAIEQFGFMQFTKPVRKAVMGKVLTSASTKRWLANTVMVYAKSIGMEVLTENIQEMVSVTAEAYAYHISKMPDKIPTYDEIYERIKETTIAVTAGTPLLGLAGGIAHGAASNPKGSINAKQRSILNKIKGKIAETGSYEEVVPNDVDFRKRVDEVESAFGKDEAGNAKIDINPETRTLKIYDVKLEAKDIMGISRMDKDGVYHVKVNPNIVEESANLIIDSFKKNKVDATVEFNDKGEISISGVSADVFESMARPETAGVLFSKKPYSFRSGVYNYIATSEKEAKGITNILRTLQKNPVVNVDFNVTENTDGSYSIQFKIQNMAEELSKRIDIDEVKITAENLEKILNDNMLEWADSEAIMSLGKAIGKLLAGEKLSKTELKAMPALAEIQDTIIDMVKEDSRDKTLFQRVADKIALVELISDFIKDSKLLSEDKIEPLIAFFAKTIREQTARSFDINLLSKKLEHFKKGLNTGRKATLSEVNNIKKLIATTIRKAIPRDLTRQAELIKKLNSITTVEQFLAEIDNLKKEIEDARIEHLKDKIMSIETDKLPVFYRDQIDIIKQAISKTDKPATAIVKSIRALYDSMTPSEKEHFFGDIKDFSEMDADSLEKLAYVAQYLKDRGKLENKMLLNDRTKKKDAAVAYFKSLIVKNGNPKIKNAQAMHLAGKGADVAGAEPKTILKSLLWILRGPTLFKFLGLTELFREFVKADLNYRENMRRTTNIMNSFLSEETMYGLLNSSVDFTEEDMEFTLQQILTRFELDEEDEMIAANRELVTTRGLVPQLVKKAMKLAHRKNGKPVEVGTVGDFLQHPAARKQFASILDVPIFIDTSQNTTDLGLFSKGNRVITIAPAAIEMSLDTKDVFAETFFHEIIHALRTELGRKSESGDYDTRVQELSANKGAEYWLNAGKEWAKSQNSDVTYDLNILQDIKDVGKGMIKDRMMLVYALMQMEDGIKVLLNSGYTYADMYVIEKVFNKKENKSMQELYKSFRGFLNEQGQRVQHVQEMVGDEAIRFVENYFPMFGLMENNAIDPDILNDLIEGKQVLSNIYQPWARHRQGGTSIKSLSFVNTVSSYAFSTEKYINLAPAFFDAQQILSSKDIKEAIQTFHGIDWYRKVWHHLSDWIIGPNKGNSVFEKVGGHFRRTAFPAYLGMNIFSVAKQPISWLIGAYVLGPQHAIRGLSRFLSNPVAAYMEASSKSLLVRNRAFTQERDFDHLNSHSLLERRSKIWQTVKKVQKFALMPHQIFDIGTVSALWIAAYDKAKTVDMLSERAARAAADELITKTQPMGGNLYIPAVLRGSELAKLYTMFSNQSTNTLSVIIESIYDIKQSDKTAMGKFMDATGASLMLILGPAFMLGLLSRKMHFSDEPDDYVFDVVNYLTAPFPLFGKFVYGLTTDRVWTSLTPVDDAFDDVNNALASKDPLSALYKLLEVSSKWGLGVPTENIKNIATGEFLEYKEKKDKK